VKIDNPEHSDLTVHIFSTLHFLVDYELFGKGQVDCDGAVSRHLSNTLNQSWLICNSLNRVRPQYFHTDYLNASAGIANCMMSMVFIDPANFCTSKDDVAVLLHSLISTNRVHKRRIVFFAHSAAEEEIQEAFHDAIVGFASEPSQRLARGIVLSAGLSVIGFADEVLRAVQTT
jgi:hypothetical protein